MAEPIVIPLATPLSERIELIRDFDRELPEDAAASDQIRRRLFAGEALNAGDVAKEFDASVSLLAAVVSALQPWGFDFERTREARDDGTTRTTYRLLNPDHTPDWDSPPPKKKRARKRPSSQRTAPSPTERPATPVRRAMAPDTPAAAMSSLPALGEEVMVSALLLDDGAVRIGLKSANGRAWVARLEGAGA